MSSLKNKKVRIAAALMPVFALAVLSLTGCGSQLLPCDGNPGGSGGIKSPVVINYVVNNPLTFQDNREGNGTEFDYSYLTVDGLKNEEIEQAVNARIKEVFAGLLIRDIPPYRGIRVRISEGAEIIHEQVFTNVVGNFNNILSITFHKYVTYQNPTPVGYSERGAAEKDPAYYDSMSYVSEMETLNFDLNTGEEIKLKDLFCDDVDHRELLNGYMSRYLAESHADEEGYYMGPYSGVKLVEPFRGLSEDQLFSISPNGIGFVFDYRTPQFDTESMAANPSINFGEFGDTIAVTERFYDEAVNIYASEAPPVKSLIFKGDKNDVGGNEYRQEGGVHISRNWRWSSGLPAEIKIRLEEMSRVDQKAVNRLKEYFSGMSEKEINDAGGGYYDLSVSGQRIGSFINIYKYSFTYTPQFGEEVFDGHCYDSGTLKEISLADIFKEGYDYKPVIMEAVRKAIEDHDNSSGGPAEKTYSEAQYEEVFNQIDGFQLSTDSIEMNIILPDREFRAASLHLYISYEDLGCDNMNIFR